MSQSAKPDLDAIDLRILHALQDDARIANIELSEKVALSPSPTSRRVRMLEEAGIIRGYHAALDREAVGFGLTVFAGVRVERHSLANADAFIEGVLEIPEVIACHLISGEHDYLLEIVAPDMATYEAEVLRRLLKVPAVRDIRTSFAMRSYRSGGLLPISAR